MISQTGVSRATCPRGSSILQNTSGGAYIKEPFAALKDTGSRVRPQLSNVTLRSARSTVVKSAADGARRIATSRVTRWPTCARSARATRPCTRSGRDEEEVTRSRQNRRGDVARSCTTLERTLVLPLCVYITAAALRTGHNEVQRARQQRRRADRSKVVAFSKSISPR